MHNISGILQRIKTTVMESDPGATVILYGSYARGDQHKDSDIDLLVLVDKDKPTYEDKKNISYPLYDIELETGILISPLIYSRKRWAKRMVTPFSEAVNTEGVLL